MDGQISLGKESTLFESDDVAVLEFEATLADKSATKLKMLRFSEVSVGTVVFDPDRGVLLVWKHQLPNDDWSWHLPGGSSKEKAASKTAKQKIEAQTGWKVDKVTKTLEWLPAPGFLDHSFTAYFATGATWVGPAPDRNEVTDLVWLPVESLEQEIAKGAITDGLTLTALLHCLNTGKIKPKTGQ